MTIRSDALECPVCGLKMNSITTQHIRKHGFQDASNFKIAFDIPFLRCPSMRREHSSLMSGEGNSMSGGHSSESTEKIRKNRKGKGLGVAGKYERTPNIRSKIAEGVSKAFQSNPEGWKGRGKGSLIASSKLGGEIWVRSSWEVRLVKVLDLHPSVEGFVYEPFRIPYSYLGVGGIYLPDFLIHLEGGIREIWEIKPSYFRTDPKSIAKRIALATFCDEKGFNHREVDLLQLEGMEMQVGILPWVGPGKPWVRIEDPAYRPISPDEYTP